MNTPEDLSYTAEHEWVAELGDGRLKVGITDYAQDALGDVVYVDLPDAGATFEAGGVVAEVESTKSVSEIYLPIAGTIDDTNEALSDSPDLVNADPYGAGWFFIMTPAEGADRSALLDAAAY
ncbi:MAG: glycine cleavage system protein GcvH, partial [Acidimicrobiia bacterium]|nr:glycine cleavage system protein GcvH [Acidimicrobiia bacterium]